MRWILPYFVLLTACYSPPEATPKFDGVPIEPSGACAPSRTSRVDCVIDGDTFDIDRCGDDVVGERFRLLGVDAPELAHDGEPADCFAAQARDALEDQLTGTDVRLVFDLECTGFFGRSLAWAFYEDEDEEEPVNASIWLVENGLARLYTEFNFDQLRYAAELQNAEASARAANIGLWGACDD